MKSIGHLTLKTKLEGHALRFTDFTGKVINGWEVLELCGWDWDSKSRRRYWYRVKCFCGDYFYLHHCQIKYRPVISCGCLVRESANKTHNRSQDKIYKAYHGMINRCYNKNHSMYSSYGGRGIEVCDRWLIKQEGFLNFLEDMGERPADMTLDRINNDGNYEPNNCRWATKTEQSYNQRKRVDNKSGIVGIRKCKNHGSWIATIRKGGKTLYLGSYRTKFEAYKVRCEAEIKYHGVGKQPVFENEDEFNLIHSDEIK